MGCCGSKAHGDVYRVSPEQGPGGVRAGEGSPRDEDRSSVAKDTTQLSESEVLSAAVLSPHSEGQNTHRLDKQLSFVDKADVMRQMASFMPHLLVADLLLKPESPQCFQEEHFFGAVLIIDISGFTKLTEKLAEEGRSGVDKLTHHVSTYFGLIIDVVHHYGGDVIRFAGDALITVFQAPERYPSTQEGKLGPVVSSLLCGLEVQRELGEYYADGIPLSLHVGCSAGNLTKMTLGGHSGDWFFIVRGEPYSHLGTAVDSAGFGEVVLAGPTRELLLRSVPFRSTSMSPRPENVEEQYGNFLDLGNLQSSVTSMPLPRSPPPEPRAPITTVDFHSADVVIRWVECNDEHDVRIISVEKGSRAAIQECPPIDSNKAFDGTGKLSRCIRSFLPKGLQGRIDAGMVALLNEMRQVSVLFVSLQTNPNADAPVGEQVHEALAIAQSVVKSKGGDILHALNDEKGTILVIGFGTLVAHHDDSVRALCAAIELGEKLENHPVIAWMGVTTGPAFCGCLGYEQRRDYTMIGDTVNLAARLMGASKSYPPSEFEYGGILCDEKTMEACKKKYDFIMLKKVYLKGKKSGIKVFRVGGNATMNSSRVSEELDFSGIPFVCRVPQLQAVQSEVTSMISMSRNRRKKKKNTKRGGKTTQNAGGLRRNQVRTSSVKTSSAGLDVVDDRSEESGSSRKLFLLEGDNGTGKTSYLQKLEEWADQQEHLRFISNTGNTMGNTGVAFSTFSRLFLDIFPNTTKGSFFMGANTSSNRSWQDQVLHVLVSILLHFLREARSQPDGDFQDEATELALGWGSLLNSVLTSLHLPESDTVKALPLEERAARTLALMRICIEWWIPTTTVLILLDDWEHFDQMSQTLAMDLFKCTEVSWERLLVTPSRANLCFVLSCKPFNNLLTELNEGSLQHAARRRGRPPAGAGPSRGPSFRVDTITLPPLELDETEEMLKSMFALGRLDRVDPAAVTFLHEKSAGNPFFLTKLVRMLKHSGALQVPPPPRNHGGGGPSTSKNPYAGRRTITLARNKVKDIPQSVQNLLMSEFDQLAPHLQLILKVASVFGLSFKFNAFHAVFCTLQNDMSQPSLLKYVDELVSLGMLSPASISDLTLSSSRITGPGFCFTNSVMQETIYELLLNAQKLSLHRSLAEIIEELTPKEELPGYFAELASHWDLVTQLLLASDAGSTGTRTALASSRSGLTTPSANSPLSPITAKGLPPLSPQDSTSSIDSLGKGSMLPRVQGPKPLFGASQAKSYDYLNKEQHAALLGASLQCRKYTLLRAKQMMCVSKKGALKLLQRAIFYLDVSVQLMQSIPSASASQNTGRGNTGSRVVSSRASTPLEEVDNVADTDTPMSLPNFGSSPNPSSSPSGVPSLSLNLGISGDDDEGSKQPTLNELGREVEATLSQVMRLADELGAAIVWLRASVRILKLWKEASTPQRQAKAEKVLQAITSPLRIPAPKKYKKEEDLLVAKARRLFGLKHR